MVCPNCGYTNQPTNRFCVRCGFDTAGSAAPGQDPASPTAMADASAPPPPPPPPAPPSPWGVPSSAAAPSPATAPGPMPPPGSMPPPPGSMPPPGPPVSPAGAPNPFAPPAPAAPPGYPQYGYGQYPPPPYPPYPPSGPWAPQSTNGLAIASLILGLVGWIPCGVGSVLAVIFGFVAQSQIRDSQGRQGGTGMAKAGIILGFVGVALVALFFTIGAVSGSSQN